jgi:hypothetical protein
MFFGPQGSPAGGSAGRRSWLAARGAAGREMRRQRKELGVQALKGQPIGPAWDAILGLCMGAAGWIGAATESTRPDCSRRDEVGAHGHALLPVEVLP